MALIMGVQTYSRQATGSGRVTVISGHLVFRPNSMTDLRPESSHISPGLSRRARRECGRAKNDCQIRQA